MCSMNWARRKLDLILTETLALVSKHRTYETSESGAGTGGDRKQKTR